MVGISAVLGGTETKIATVQAEGMAFKMSVDGVQQAFKRAGFFPSGTAALHTRPDVADFPIGGL